MKIPENTFNAIMANALRAFRRENWLLEAGDIKDATGKPVVETMQAFFAPFCDRLLASATEIPEGKQGQARDILFREFSKLALGE